MMSVFKRLIRRELGESCYNKYFTYIQKNLKNRSLESREVYEDIYLQLKDRDIESIAHMHDRLNDAMVLAFRISKTYLIAFLAYLVATLILLLSSIPNLILVISLLLVSVLFLIRTYEFILNKYSFVDAQMVLVYKAVLEKIILGHVKFKDL